MIQLQIQLKKYLASNILAYLFYLHVTGNLQKIMSRESPGSKKKRKCHIEDWQCFSVLPNTERYKKKHMQ